MISYFCKECGYESNQWMGKCPSCNVWDSFTETARVTGKKAKEKKLFLDKIDVTPLSQVKVEASIKYKTGISEFDTVLGGGLVQGMSALIGGEPGIGKSTIMIQIAYKLASMNLKVLYASGEESPEQIYLRSERLGVLSDNILLYCINDAEAIFTTIKTIKPDIVIIDSIQSVYISHLDNFPGSITQIRECALLFTQMAKSLSIPLFMIGHVNKEGLVAGPKILEHIVDTVLYFEGELSNQFKILRTTKNRFGSTNEIGLFEMTDTGLREVVNPSELFIEHTKTFPGTAISCVLEGSRAFLIEVQALVTRTNYGNAQRISVGFDQKRLSLLLAVIEKHLGINMKEYDVFINFSGGIKIFDTSADLAIILAILSSIRDLSLPEKTIFIGEIGLNGDIRNVNQVDKRLKESIKLGYQKVYIPDIVKSTTKKMETIKIASIKEVLSLFSVFVFFFVSLLYSDMNQIQLARVQYDGGGDWYNDPEILPNFADFIAKNLPININKRERVVKLSDTVIFQYPFLFMTGHGNIVASESEVMNLRNYLTSGGFLYVDDDYGLDESFRRFINRVFPEKSLVELPNSHSIFSCFFNFSEGLPKIHEHDGKRPQLFAILDDKGRIMVLYTYESNISDGWADFDTHNDPPEVKERAFQFGLNMFHHLFIE